jgi:hypothetical protein
MFEKGNRIIRGVRILKHSQMRKLNNSFWDRVPYFNEVTFKGVLSHLTLVPSVTSLRIMASGVVKVLVTSTARLCVV